MTDAQTWVRITRDFDAPIETVWRMWTDADLFRRWYGPMGMSVPVAEMDVTPGGTRRISMEMSSPRRSMTMWFTGTYREVVAPTRLVYTEAMCDEGGTLIPPEAMGMPKGSPDFTEVTVELSATPGGTRMVMTHRGLPAGSPGEKGWTMAFDKLAETLAAG